MFSPFTDRRLFRARATILALGADPVWTQAALDTFTDPTGTDLQNHTADVGGGWTCDAVWEIQFNQATYDRNTLTPSMSYAQMSADRGDNNIRVSANFFRGNDDPFIAPYQEIGGITFLQKSDDISNGEGCAAYFKSISAGQVELIFERRGAGGAIQQQQVLATLNVAPNSSAGVLRAVVVGESVTITNGTTVYPSITIPNLRDGTHRRAGLCALTGDPSGRYFMDNFTVETTS